MATAPEFIEDSEEIILQKSVAFQRAQYAGKLYLTSQGLKFHCTTELGPDNVHHFTNQVMSYPFSEIEAVSVKKKFVIFNMLSVKLAGRDELNFWFGVMSADQFVDEIQKRI